MRPGQIGAHAQHTIVARGAACLAKGAAFASGLIPAAAFAQVTEGMSHSAPGQIGMMQPVTPIAREMTFFHDVILLPIIVVISLFVLALLLYVVYRFNETSNPTPSRTTHHTGLEVAWTAVPLMILVIIAIPSFRLLTRQITVPESDMTLKVSGKQWYWTYTYSKDQNGGFEFDSNLLDQTKLPAGKLRLLDVDNEAVVPVGKVIRLQITADAVGVIHSFTIPAFGVRMDAVPGRLNESWFKAEREGVYYGQCSKLCGKDHAFMPIAFRVVSEEAYKTWLNEAKGKFASSAVSVTVADASIPAQRQ
ncbi:MAG: cytochrome c oxidase, subunit [Hyphomicrobiales bacterium]|nr:cytochrome c oxidase, subunit [Hyphomicrobiales bacterium]